MIRGDLRLVAVFMTGNASEDGIARGVGVAIAARGPLAVVVSAVYREVALIVCRKLRAGPIHEGVTTVAGGRETRGCVVRIGRVLIFELVATVAIGRR